MTEIHLCLPGPVLARHGLIGLQDLFNPSEKLSQLGLAPALLLPVAWRLAAFQNLLVRQPVNLRLPKNLPPADPRYQHPPANLSPLLHIAIQVSWLMKMPHFWTASSHS